MGRGDNRRTPKSRQRKAQRRKLRRLRRLKEGGIAASKGTGAPATLSKARKAPGADAVVTRKAPPVSR